MNRLKAELEPGLSAEQAKVLLHDLRVHQIELEAQNAELRKAQAELHEARARYFDLYELAPVGYFSLSELGIILQLNLSVTNLLGLSKRGALRQPLLNFVHPDDRPRFLTHRKQLFDSNARQVCELRMLRELEPIWVQLESVTNRSADGAVQWRATLSDITERVRAEQALRASETRYRVLFENSRDALMTLAPPSWRFSSGNAAALALFAVASEAALCERTFWDTAPECQPDGLNSRVEALEMIETAMRDGAHFFEWSYLRPTGKRSSASVLFNRIELDGQAVLQATMRDETEAKALQARMAQADRLATMGMIAAGVAHEINNPLTYVTFNLERVAALVQASRSSNSAENQPAATSAGAHSPEIERCLQQALDGVHRIKTISRGLGTFSRIEDPEMSRLSLNIAAEHAVTIAVNEIRFRARLNKELGVLPPVLASESKLAQVFLNLLVNAAHAIEEGAPDSNSITLRTWAEAGRVFAEVSDTGSGIAAADMERIFEPFFTTKPAGTGSGLGLPICRSIVTRFGGSIEAHSTPGEGSRFVLAFPAAADLSAEPVVTPVVAQTRSAQRGRILVVDDEPAIRSAVGHLLRQQHEVVTAASGAEARALLEQDRAFDLVLCDLMMPRMSGMELHAWLSAFDPALAEQVVFISGGAFTPKVAGYLASVSNVRLDKPFDLQTLMRVVNAKVDAAHSKRADAPSPVPGSAARE